MHLSQPNKIVFYSVKLLMALYILVNSSPPITDNTLYSSPIIRGIIDLSSVKSPTFARMGEMGQYFDTYRLAANYITCMHVSAAHHLK